MSSASAAEDSNNYPGSENGPLIEDESFPIKSSSEPRSSEIPVIADDTFVHTESVAPVPVIRDESFPNISGASESSSSSDRRTISNVNVGHTPSAGEGLPPDEFPPSQVPRCRYPECSRPRFVDDNGSVKDFCGLTHRDSYFREYPQGLPLEGQPPLPTCKYPNCSRPCYREDNGHVFEFCGKTHGQQYQRELSQGLLPKQNSLGLGPQPSESKDQPKQEVEKKHQKKTSVAIERPANVVVGVEFKPQFTKRTWRQKLRQVATYIHVYLAIYFGLLIWRFVQDHLDAVVPADAQLSYWNLIGTMFAVTSVTVVVWYFYINFVQQPDSYIPFCAAVLGEIIACGYVTNELVHQGKYSYWWSVYFILYMITEIIYFFQSRPLFRILASVTDSALDAMYAIRKHKSVLLLGVVGLVLQVPIVYICAAHYDYGVDFGIFFYVFLMEVPRNIVHYTAARVAVNSIQEFERGIGPVASELRLTITKRMGTIMMNSIFSTFDPFVSVLRNCAETARNVTLAFAGVSLNESEDEQRQHANEAGCIWGWLACIAFVWCAPIQWVATRLLRLTTRYNLTIAAYTSSGYWSSRRRMTQLRENSEGFTNVLWEYNCLNKLFAMGAVMGSCACFLFCQHIADPSGITFFILCYICIRTVLESLEGPANVGVIRALVDIDASKFTVIPHAAELMLVEISLKKLNDPSLLGVDTYKHNPLQVLHPLVLRSPGHSQGTMGSLDGWYFTCPICFQHTTVPSNFQMQLTEVFSIQCHNCEYVMSSSTLPWRIQQDILEPKQTTCCCGKCRCCKRRNTKHLVQHKVRRSALPDKISSHLEYDLKDVLEFSYKHTWAKPYQMDSRVQMYNSMRENFNRSEYMRENFEIKRMTLLHNETLLRRFENYVNGPRGEMKTNFTPWQQRELRAFEESVIYQAPNGTKVIPCWQGTRWENEESISNLGMLNLAELDKGWFGAGIYAAIQLEYSTRYSTGAVITMRGNRPNLRGEFVVFFCYVAVRNVYPLTYDTDRDPTGAHDSRWYGSQLYPGSDGHYTRVYLPEEKTKAYTMPPSEGAQTYEEIVVPSGAQFLPVAAIHYAFKKQKTKLI